MFYNIGEAAAHTHTHRQYQHQRPMCKMKAKRDTHATLSAEQNVVCSLLTLSLLLLNYSFDTRCNFNGKKFVGNASWYNARRRLSVAGDLYAQFFLSDQSKYLFCSLNFNGFSTPKRLKYFPYENGPATTKHLKTKPNLIDFHRCPRYT